MVIPEDCKGCRLTHNRGGHYSRCIVKLYCSLEEISSCPCSICLIKGICGRRCDVFHNYVKKLNGYLYRVYIKDIIK